ncbi:MAG: hypothetical protein Harvfovirus2_61 [Harvfovirus sp.]|uniref:Uncharacterized protein n=1 Tax=Harvfovirus sp. TaxID=2487768 RepID=A0A3G5A2W7_9VIRU|nr:MAG: hypothetical protein Harvfovirus2_61 [Harvfovirus sp.]
MASSGLAQTLLPYLLSGLATWAFNKNVLQPFGICDSFFKDPVMFIILALSADKFSSRFPVEQRKTFYDLWAKAAAVVCALWCLCNALIDKEIKITIEALAWAVDLFMVVVQTSILSGKFNLKALLMNPTYPFLDLFCSNKPVLILQNANRIWIITIISESFLWFSLVYLWSKNHCFIDDMMDISTPFGFYSTTMVTIMFLNFVAYIRNSTLPLLPKSIMIIISFYNTTFAVAMFFIYISPKV